MSLSESVDVPLPKVIATACLVTWFNPQALIDGAVMLGAFKGIITAGPGYVVYLGGSSGFNLLWFLAISTIILLFSANYGCDFAQNQCCLWYCSYFLWFKVRISFCKAAWRITSII